MPTAEEVLQQATEEFQKAKENSGDWYPPVGEEYDVTLTETTVEMRGDYVWLTVYGEIENGEYEGRSFKVVNCTPKTLFIAVQVAKKLGGDVDGMDSPLELKAFFEAHAAASIRLRMSERKAKNGKVYPDVQVLGLID